MIVRKVVLLYLFCSSSDLDVRFIYNAVRYIVFSAVSVIFQWGVKRFSLRFCCFPISLALPCMMRLVVCILIAERSVGINKNPALVSQRRQDYDASVFLLKSKYEIIVLLTVDGR